MKAARERVSPRFDVGKRFGHLGWEVQAELLNVGLGGMAARLETSLAPGMTVHVEFQQADGVLGLDGTAKWCRPADVERFEGGGSKRYYEAGVQFSGTLADRGEELVDFINSRPVVSVKRGTFGRFELDYPHPVILRPTCPFRLKLLSYSGMLVETSVELARDCRVDLSIPLGSEDFVACGHVADVTAGDESDLPYEVGIGFDELSKAQDPVLRAFVERFLGHQP